MGDSRLLGRDIKTIEVAYRPMFRSKGTGGIPNHTSMGASAELVVRDFHSPDLVETRM